LNNHLVQINYKLPSVAILAQALLPQFLLLRGEEGMSSSGSGGQAYVHPWADRLAAAHFGVGAAHLDVGEVFRRLLEDAARRPVARPELASRLARRGCASLRAHYALATLFIAPAGARPCDRCGSPTGLWCEECTTRVHDDEECSALCSWCAGDCGSCFHCAPGDRPHDGQ
jgi:hypothetical protein